MEHFKAVLIFALAVFSSSAFGGQLPEKSNLWANGKMPKNDAQAQTALENQIQKEIRGEQKQEVGKVRIRAVKEPYFRFFAADAKSADGKKGGLVIVAPGGGYYQLVADHEGEDICRKLNGAGISAMLLIYRVPQNPKGALQDIQRAIRIARTNAKKWNIDKNKIAVIGFSAGANLCARASTNFEKLSYEAVDDIDSASARPDNTLLIYPVYCDADGNAKRWGKPRTENVSYAQRYALADDLKIDKNTPPAFIIQSENDKNYIDSSFAYYLALKDANVPACLHIFDSGGHGYGLGKKGMRAHAWGDMAIDWLKSYGY